MGHSLALLSSVAVPVVIVEIAPSPPPELARTLVDTCTHAIRDGKCVLDSDAAPTPGSTVAIVRWEGASERAVHVEVGTRRSRDSKWEERTLEFGDADQRAERWRSVGLTIATLVGARSERATETESGESSPNPVEAGAPAVPKQSQRALAPKPGEGLNEVSPLDEKGTAHGERLMRPRSAAWLDLGALGGPSLDDHHGLRYGAWVAGGLRPTHAAWFVRIDGSYAVMPADSFGLSVQWAAAGLGIGASVRVLDWMDLEPRAEATFDFVRASIREPTTNLRDSGTDWGYGVRAGADVVLRLGAVDPLIGIEAFRTDAPTDIFVRDTHLLGTVPDTGWTVIVGARIELF